MSAHVSLPDEFVLVAACCCWPPSPERDAAVRAAAAIRDWDCLVRMVARHRVAGLVHAALDAAGVEPEADAARTLARGARRIALRNIVLANESAQLQAAFDAAQIPALILKGSTLALLAYGTTALKQARDIDLLVSAGDAEAAMHRLEHAGYRRVSPPGPMSESRCNALIRYGREIEFVHDGKNIRLELQWRLVDNRCVLVGIGTHGAVQSVALPDGRQLRTLAVADLFAYLCVHGASHSWARLKWLADVNAMIAMRNDADIERLYRYAESKSAGPCAGLALLLCAKIFGRPLPPALMSEINGSRRVRYLAALALKAMAAPDIDRAGFAAVTRNVLAPFLFGRGWRFLAGQCRAASVGVADVLRLPLPAPLHFVYPLLRLPLWLWRRSAAAIRRKPL